jgi:hypothetical protein
MYIQIHIGDSGERGWGDLLIPIPIYDSGDQSSPYPFPNRWISHGFVGNGAPLPSLAMIKVSPRDKYDGNIEAID